MFNTPKSRLFNLNLISLTASDLGIVSMFPLKIDACFNRRWRAGGAGELQRSELAALLTSKNAKDKNKTDEKTKE